MFITSRDGKFLEVNKTFAELTGYSTDELIGRDVHQLYENQTDRLEYQNQIESNGSVQDYQIVLKSRDGNNLFCLVDAISWKNGDEIQGYYGIVRTRSEIRKAFQDYFNRLKSEREKVRDERKSLLSETMLLMRYGSDDLVEYVEKTGRNPLESGRRKVSILFFDIKNSTKIAEQLQPEVFTSFLSDILVDIMDLVYGNHGSVNKLLGDGLMASFGAPIETGADAFNAVNVAEKIQNYLDTYNDVRPDYLSERIEAGVGIATGEVFAGLIGSIRLEEYTMLGDTVNIAARLEKLTREIDRDILIDEATYLEVRKRVSPVKKYQISIKGRSEKIAAISI